MIESALNPARRKTIDRVWWAGVGVIVLIGGVFRFTGYQVGLPYFDHYDEPWLFYEAAYQRGLIDSWTHPNPSPGLINLYKLAQIVTETITGQPSIDQTAHIFAVMRIISVILSLITLVLIALCGRELAGRKAGWLAALVWALIPLVIYHSIIAIAEPWMMLFAALALYTAVRGIESSSAGYAIASVWAGLFGFAFKYSMFPFPGLGIAVVLWRILREKSRRPYWWRALLTQIVSIAGFLAVLVVFEGLAQSVSAPSREIAFFFRNPLSRLTNFDAVSSVFLAAFPQFNTHFIIYLIVYAAGLLMLVRTHRPVSRVVLWVLFGLLGSFLTLLVALYVYVPGTLERYLFSANMVFILVGAGSLAVLYDCAAERIRTERGRTLLAGLSAAAVILWLLPLGLQAAQEAHTRTLPQTYTDMMIWASNTLGKGGILTETMGMRAFSREFGGYMGDYREQSYDSDLLSQLPAAWQHDGYEYVEMLQDQEQTLLQTDAGRAYLEQLQELRRFPPPESTEEWYGPSFVVYQFSRPTMELDAVFGDTFHLVGCECDFATVQPGDAIRLRFYWHALRTPARDYSVFVHFSTADSDTLLAQADGAPGPVHRPTQTWVLPSELLVSDDFTLTLPQDTAPGTYRLILGVYNWETGERLPTADGDSILLARVQVE